MNFFGKKNGRFGDEDDFYKIPLEEEDDALEEIDSTEGVPSSATDSGVGIGGSSIELKVVHSEKFEDVVMVAEHLLNHCTVVLPISVRFQSFQRKACLGKTRVLRILREFRRK